MDRFKRVICIVLIFGTTALIALGAPVSFYPLYSLGLYTLGFIGLYIFVFKLQTTHRLSSPLLFIVITGIILRTLFFSYPLSDDVNRYAWEGMIQAQGVNPYLTAPAILDAEFSHDPIFAGINHKTVSTAYPPVAILTFRALSTVSYSLTAYKLFFIICDSLVLILLVLLIKQWQLPANRLALYAWNPLILLYGAGEGHFDLLHILFIVAALLLFAISSRKKAKTENRSCVFSSYLSPNPNAQTADIQQNTAEQANISPGERPASGNSTNHKFRFPTANECLITYSQKLGLFAGLAFFMLGMAVMTKFLSLIILPFMITRRNAKWLPCFFIPFLTIIPFWSPDMTSGLMKFSGAMSYNDVIPKLLRYFLSGTFYQLAMVTVFALGMGIIWLMTQQNRFTGILYTFLWCIFCLPCVHIWYLMPLALFIIAVPNRAIFLMFITIGSGFWVLNHQLLTGEWREFLWIWLVTYVPVMLLLLYDWNNITLPWLKSSPAPQSVDIIIPVYNEAERITAHLTSVEQAIQTALVTNIEFKVTIVDGGSTDNTLELVKDFIGEAFERRTPNIEHSISNNKTSRPKFENHATTNRQGALHQGQSRLKPERRTANVQHSTSNKQEKQKFLLDGQNAKNNYQLINSPKGRGNQLATGFANSSGDMVIMLHADSIIHQNTLLNFTNTTVKNPTAGWGILGHNYDKKSLRMNKVRFMNRFRFKVMGIAFGDQGIWVRRDIMIAKGGIPAVPLMEDIEISLRLSGVPRLSMGESLTLSTRRWANRTLFTYSLQVIYFVIWYMLARRLGFNIKNVSAKLYTKYYKA